MIVLNANDIDGGFTQSSIVRFDAQSSQGFDSEFDSYFVSGFAPLFYSVTSGNNFLLNTLPEMTSDLSIPFAFVKNNAENFSIELTESLTGAILFLEDKKLNKIQNLAENPVYYFSSEQNDDANRFVLHFSALGIEEPTAAETFTIYQQASVLYINSPSDENAEIRITDMAGKVVIVGRTNGNDNTPINVSNLRNGVYIVSLIDKNRFTSKKIVITN
jgi:hypothetical protein